MASTGSSSIRVEQLDTHQFDNTALTSNDIVPICNVDPPVTSHHHSAPSESASTHATSSADNASGSVTSPKATKKPLKFFAYETKGFYNSIVLVTPNGTKHWRPVVDADCEPKLDSTFTRWDDIVTMYKTYASKSGFTTRVGTSTQNKDHTAITHRYLVCSKSGTTRKTNFKPSDIDKAKRRSRSSRTNCKACIKIRYDTSTKIYTLYCFNADHNHCMISSDNADLMRQNRQLTFDEHQFIHKVSMQKIGPSVAHNLQVSLKSGHRNVVGTKEDFKIFSRDIRVFVGDRDAQLLMETLSARVNNLQDFVFDYVVTDNVLRCVFFTDFVSRRNYEAFGDVCAFDATYDTNMYRMIFVPFTGVDHHKRCITFGAGLIDGEKGDTFTWLCRCFLSVHKKQPIFILTDQDTAMRNAVTTVFDQSVHRLCMWHIMRKLPFKLKEEPVDDKALRMALHKIIWNLYITPETFESRWHIIINEYNLQHHPWLIEMYSIRDEWVPCYFRDLPMSCLMKTTSRCESSNAHFKVNSRDSNTLVQFLMCFDTALDSQRYMQRKVEFQSDNTRPEMLTLLPIEVHASTIYTWSLFIEVQKEIFEAMHHCVPIELSTSSPTMKHYNVRHCTKNMVTVNMFQVSFDTTESIVECSCLLFRRIGYLCRHAFCILRVHDINFIPSRYILPRWRRDALPTVVHSISYMYTAEMNEIAIIKNDITDMIGKCMNRLRSDPDRLRAFSDQIKELRNRIYDEFPVEPRTKSKIADISDLLNLPENSGADINIHPPHHISNKGCGTKKKRRAPCAGPVKRKKTRSRRLCNECDTLVRGHDTRNCKKIQAMKLAKLEAKRFARKTEAIAAGRPVPADDEPITDSDADYELGETDVSSDNDKHTDDDNDDDYVSDNDDDEDSDPPAKQAKTKGKSSNPKQPLRRSSRCRAN